MRYLIFSLLCVIELSGCHLSRSSQASDPPALQLRKGLRIVLIGNNLSSRMMNYGHFETELHLRYPDSLLFIRNMADGGNTPGFRPHSGRVSPWALLRAETVG